MSEIDKNNWKVYFNNLDIFIYIFPLFLWYYIQNCFLDCNFSTWQKYYMLNNKENKDIYKEKSKFLQVKIITLFNSRRNKNILCKFNVSTNIFEKHGYLFNMRFLKLY